MNARPLRWWSKAALETVAQPVEAAWRQWCADWDVTSGPVSAINAGESIARERCDAEWRRADDAGLPGLWLHVEGGEDGLARMLFGPGSRPPSLAAEVAAEAWAELMQKMSAACQATAARHLYQTSISVTGDKVGPERPKQTDWHTWSGAIAFEFVCKQRGAVRLVGHMRQPDAERLIGAEYPPLAAPGDRDQGLPQLAPMAGQPVRLSVQLDELSLDLGTLQSLRAGDVLIFPHKLDLPLHLRYIPERLPATAGPALCGAYLRARAGWRAVELSCVPAPA